MRPGQRPTAYAAIGAQVAGIEILDDRADLGSQAGRDLRRRQEGGRHPSYGQFLTVTVNFIIIAWILFLVIRHEPPFQQEQAASPRPPAKQGAGAADGNSRSLEGDGAASVVEGPLRLQKRSLGSCSAISVPVRHFNFVMSAVFPMCTPASDVFGRIRAILEGVPLLLIG